MILEEVHNKLMLFCWGMVFLSGVNGDTLGAQVVQQAFQPTKEPMVTGQIPFQEPVI